MVDVIPVQTGIHTAVNKTYYVYILARMESCVKIQADSSQESVSARSVRQTQGIGVLWIPACAGMTLELLT